MKTIRNKLFKQLSEKYDMDARIIQTVVDHVIKFSNKVISDDEDLRPVRIRYLGSFVPKASYVKKINNMQPAL